MGRIRSITAVACTALLLGAAGAAAQTADRSTYVTFSGPISVPGTTLPAGTYTFRLADSPADRHIVQIFDKDQTKLFATLLAVAAERNQAEGEPVVTFRETPSNMPPALRYWYYAGEKSGNEFVYPKSQALTIARASGEDVLAIDTDSADIEDMKKGTPARVSANAEPQSPTAQTAIPATTTEPSANPAQTTPPPMAAAPERPAPTTAPAATAQAERPTGTSGRSEPSELPRTASELPAIGLIGAFALAAALALRAARKAIV